MNRKIHDAALHHRLIQTDQLELHTHSGVYKAALDPQVALTTRYEGTFYVAALINSAELIILKPDKTHLTLEMYFQIALPTLLGDRRYIASWEPRYNQKPPTYSFNKLVRMREHYDTFTHIGAVCVEDSITVFVNLAQLHAKVTDIDYIVKTFHLGYKKAEKAAEVTCDVLVLPKSPRNIMGIREVEDCRMFNRAAKLFGYNPDVNSHYSFPDQLRDTAIRSFDFDECLANLTPRQSAESFQDASSEEVLDEHYNSSKESIQEEVVMVPEQFYLFLGTQPAAAVMSAQHQSRWRSSNKETLIFAHPLLSTAFYPNQRLSGYSWHPRNVNIIALADTAGRVGVWDLFTMRLLLFWKTLRQVQVAWVEEEQQVVICTVDDPIQPILPLKEGKVFHLLLYLPRGGVLQRLNVNTRETVLQQDCPKDGMLIDSEGVAMLITP